MLPIYSALPGRMQQGAPDRFTFHIPNNATPGNIIVERADSPLSLTVYPVLADFTLDQKLYFSVTGIYAGKTEVNMFPVARKLSPSKNKPS